MREQRGGAIVNLSSLGGQMSFAGFGDHSASKFALERMSEALAQEVAPFGIKVLIVEPGAFRTAFASAGALRHMPVLSAYSDIVGGIRAFALGMDGTQASDPMKASQAVSQALEAPDTPLRLLLGADAVGAVRAHAETMVREIAAWEFTSVATAH
jgi:NAD(P)-dependent dehydrogenase (short-subunit alcohol dehydrogenase family)